MAELTNWIISSNFRWMSSWSSCERALKKIKISSMKKKNRYAKNKMTKCSLVFPGWKVRGFGSVRLCWRLWSHGLQTGGQGNKITYGKGTGGSSRELTYNKEPICYVQVVNKTHITEVNLRVIWCAPCYQEERCHEFGHPAVLSIRDSSRPECPIRAPLFPTLALPCWCWNRRCRVTPSPIHT